MALSRWLQNEIAETTMEDKFNPSPQLKPTLRKCFQVVVAVVMAVAMFVVPIQTVYATPTIQFTESGQALGNSNSTDVSLGDVDADGDLDAFVTNFGQPNKVWLNDGKDNFTDSQQALGNSYSHGMSLGDVDADGDLDVFVANSRNQPNKVWLNDGSGYFTDSQQVLVNSNSIDVSLGDVDGDGDLDAFVANNGPNRVWLNYDGKGNFTDSQQALGNSYSIDVSLGDVDGDGDLDAFVANYALNKVWLNDGKGNFTDSQQALGNSKSYRVSLGDVDADSDLDAFVANYGQPNKVWLNDGKGKFIDSQQALGNSSSYRVSLGDLDGDSDLDAFVANNGRNKVWLNNLDRYTNYPPTDLALSNNTIDENEPGNSVVGRFSTTDSDDKTFTYQLVSGNGDTDNSAFTIDGEQLQIKESPDYETQSNYSIRVATTDSVGGNFQKVFTIDVKDHPTDITLRSVIITIDESEPANSVVGTFSTIDPDDNTFTYELVSGDGDTDNSAFTIDGEQLKIKESPDYDVQSTYSIRVATTDSVGGTFQKVFAINVNDVNYPPTNLIASNTTINENVPANSVVGTFSTTDIDDNTFTYQLVSGNGDTDNSAFTIDGDQLQIKESPNYEAQSTYSIRVETTDSEGGTFQQVFTINVNDINEPPTDLILRSNTIAIDENVPANSVVGTLSTTDASTDETFTYEFVTGNGDTDNSAFTIDGEQLKIKESPDHETKSTYSIRVETTDSVGGTFQKVFTVKVNNLVE
ncbi:FG-GAP-like repeat-containing protein [Hydrocoleum sp. CS-953]|uniref:FG-GAP-like repeat-containing protein n=1 Tax=Hydrocoleum sp. CS-953 TaxID=1671698 RepID=UPI000B9A56D1|nr:FG-GAP-like repeat-containing protein [Hydrocoleum sp. CS-953]